MVLIRTCDEGIPFRELFALIEEISMVRYSSYCALFFVFIFQACSSQFENPVMMPRIDIAKSYESIPRNANPIFVQEVVDARKKKDFIHFDEASYETHAEIGPVVREALTQALTKKGYVNQAKPVFVLKLEVQEWNASVIDEFFLSHLTAKAHISLAVYEMQGHKVYSGKFSGESLIKKINFSNESLTQALSVAMQQAIDTLVEDKNLQEVLAKKTN